MAPRKWQAHPYQGHSIELGFRFLGSDAAVSPVHRAILDTGATVSMFDLAHTAVAGIADVESGRPRDLVVANGAQAQGYEHDVAIEVLGMRLVVPGVFVPEWGTGTGNLLGMEGFLDQFAFYLEHRFRELLVYA
ncbi:MAG: hypothetical protein M0027_18920 [Candidatus Dormibacteraeota bacterium]|jgi:predicted aspartyl protease|nr:hypothetical protein [Candidatus Dormibacteraeota bacterium]